MDVVIPPRTRRTHSQVFKQSALSACSEPGVSGAGMALANVLPAKQMCRIGEDVALRYSTGPAYHLTRTTMCEFCQQRRFLRY